jgi:hypothetical protein
MRRFGWVVVLLAVVVVGAYLGAARRTTGPPLDPASTAPDGARALVALVEELGGSVAVVDGPPTDDFDRALLLEDRLSRADADALLRWVREGGRLVVADTGSLLTPAVAGGVVDRITGRCEVDGLRPVETVDVGLAQRYQVPAGATGCFTEPGGAAFVVSRPEGSGTVVSVGGPDLFTNDLLDEADNAVLAAGLLAGEGTETAFLRPALPGAGDRGLVDLVDTPVRAALAQLLVAFLVVVLWRARRLGAPVEEPQPVAVEASELTRAVGRLLAANRRPDRAGAILRDRARRDLSAPLGLPLDATVDAVVHAVTARTSLGERDVRRAVSDPVRSDADLVEVADLLVRIREEITHEHPAPTA